eukprot:CAMPEP_0184348532 /NCGR_PEP_ID=MMETSP1089-20130417/27719_1 /TAXON_ID=38269 ORGANISM="Gloeochaete wittrockiana, Strain SAG46.84" /NCGR_SAMPLE_ID=MMETSP1089 /ASSEMBLY_ACC=CAM_ASM_000445 /LENGTH=60 /DNA_ID=CAMNT_0026680279 /DNA_START=65 /DNA_END=247 /DNA_ORIENTATION=+
MTRGDQRERSRQKAEARKAKHEPKGNKEGLSPSQRAERDAEAMREKQRAREAAAAGGGHS